MWFLFYLKVYNRCCFPFNLQMTELYDTSTIHGPLFNFHFKFYFNCIQPFHSRPTIQHKNSTTQTFNRRTSLGSFWACTVHLSVVEQLKEPRLCFYYSPSTDFHFSRSTPIREKASQLV